MNLDLEKTPFAKVKDVVIPDIFFNRLSTGNDDFDSVFGEGGILPGSTITLKAPAGAGKTVFSLTLAEQLTLNGYTAAYASGEEDVRQLAYNCRRLSIKETPVGGITDVDELLDVMEELDFMVIDSFQTLTTMKDLNSRARIKYFINHLVKRAKDKECALLFIVQLTSGGQIRGGTELPFAVDVNMEIRKDKDDPSKRIIDNYKNRFGPTLMHHADFGGSGYTFLGEYEETEKDEPAKTPKQSIKDVRKKQILELDEPPLITVQRVMETCAVKEQTAKLLLTDLENEMKIIKYGRGINAVWKHHKVKVN